MSRLILFLASGLLLAGVATAQESTSNSGRYEIAPDGDGFVRLDTETGTLAHCGKSDGVWRCRVIAEEQSEFGRRIQALGDEVTALKLELGRLNERLGSVEESDTSDLANPPVAQAPSIEQREREFDEALSFAERMMRRFFDMVRELKSEEPPQQT